MGLLSYDPMDDGESASANLWNIRLSAIHDLLNGNINAANLANGAVTTPKIADGAVTSAKLDIEYTIDDNGWQVFNFGSNKRYVYSAVKIPGGTRNFTGIPYPVGVTRDAILEVSCNLVAKADDGTGDWGRTWISCRLNASDIDAFQKMYNESTIFPTGILQIVIVA